MMINTAGGDFVNHMSQGQGGMTAGAMNMLGSTPDPVIYLIEPNRARQISDQAHRPFVYNFNDQWTYRVGDAVSQAVNGNTAPLNGIYNDPLTTSALRPMDQPDSIIRMGQLSEAWKFIFTAPVVRSDISAFSTLQAHKIICFGYFIGDPINPATGTVNDEAVMTFTHKIVVEDMQTQGLHSTLHTSTSMNVQLCPSSAAMYTTNSELAMLDPVSSLKSVQFGADGKGYSFPAYDSMLKTANMTPRIPTAMSVSRDNVKTVVDSMVSAYRSSSTLHSSGYDGLHSASDILKGSFTETLGNVVGTQMLNMAYDLGPDVDSSWSFGRLRAQYPRMNWQKVMGRGNNSGMVDITDQTALTPRNVFSSLLISVIPALMGKYGISDLAFEYQSFFKTPVPRHTEPNVKHAATLLSYPQATLKQRVNNVFNELMTGIFAMMVSERGDFYINAYFSVGGMTMVNLNFDADSMIVDGYVESPTLLDGITTPMMGTPQAMANNSSQVSELINAAVIDRINPDMSAQSYSETFNQSGGYPTIPDMHLGQQHHANPQQRQQYIPIGNVGIGQNGVVNISAPGTTGAPQLYDPTTGQPINHNHQQGPIIIDPMNQGGGGSILI